MTLEEMKVATKALVKETIENVLNEATEVRLQCIQEAAKERSGEDDGDEGKGDGEGKDPEGDDEGSDDDDEETELTEAFLVKAHSGKNKIDELTFKNLREFTRFAKTSKSKYKYYQVEDTRTGEETEYTVDKDGLQEL